MKKFCALVVFIMFTMLLLIGCNTVAFQDTEGTTPSQPEETKEATTEEIKEPNMPSGEELMKDNPSSEPPAPANEINEAGARGRELVELQCTLCHTLERVNSARHDRAGWEATINRMVKNGAAISEDEEQAIRGAVEDASVRAEHGRAGSGGHFRTGAGGGSPLPSIRVSR